MQQATKQKDSAMFLAVANALAGAVGGMIAMTIVQPLDVVRAELQSKATDKSLIEVGDSNISSPHPSIEEEEIMDDYKEEKKEEFIIKKQIGIKQVIGDIYKNEGIGGFYRALSSQLITLFLSDIIYFFVVTLIKQILYGKREVDAMSNLKASTIAGLMNVAITSPCWRAQTQLILQRKKK
eukprot:226960_1